MEINLFRENGHQKMEMHQLRDVSNYILGKKIVYQTVNLPPKGPRTTFGPKKRGSKLKYRQTEFQMMVSKEQELINKL